jgi:outer membrane protein OmpA-like peptidoglycan-associated protein
MIRSIRNCAPSGTVLSAAVAASLVLAACATTPVSPQGSAEVRTKLTQLQADPKLATRAPVAVKEAEAAVQVAEQPLTNDAADAALGAHRVYIADRKVDIAIADASTSYAEDQRAKLAEQRDAARLDARTREADKANRQAVIARDDADAARASAAGAAQDAALQAEELKRQIDVLHAEATDRGLVVTLGDVLFATGSANLKDGGTANLNKLVAFLNKYPTRTVAIEGHTDNVGSEESNQGLSQRRADSVKAYLTQQGISSQRLVASGKGENQPLADNSSESGRQQNRRVEVIIENPPPATASVSHAGGPNATAVVNGPR